MIAINRFRVSEGDVAGFRSSAEAAVAFYLTRQGCRSAELVRNLDDPSLWALVSRWDDVGSYRRGFNGYDAKVILTPILSQALDEPGAFGHPDEVGRNVPRECVRVKRPGAVCRVAIHGAPGR